MKSLRSLSFVPASTPLLADDILEFHAMRLLLLFKLCGVAGRIDGLTKMAKLDFFVRYPEFFDEICHHLGKTTDSSPNATRAVESSMVRFHYGPWDRRYYHVLSYLVAKGLLAVERVGNMYRFQLSEEGKRVAVQAEERSAYATIIQQMKRVKEVLGGKAGSTLKDLVYEVFSEEVKERPLGEVIR